MEVSKVSQADGKSCAHLIELVSLVCKLLDALRLAGLPVSGPGVDGKEAAKRWISSVAQQMAADLQKQEAEKPMVIKSISAPQKLVSSNKPKASKKARK